MEIDFIFSLKQVHFTWIDNDEIGWYVFCPAVAVTDVELLPFTLITDPELGNFYYYYVFIYY